jgi:hypothetical protein
MNFAELRFWGIYCCTSARDNHAAYCIALLQLVRSHTELLAKSLRASAKHCLGT